jgi:ligand-binding sensor domain-containing protein
MPLAGSATGDGTKMFAWLGSCALAVCLGAAAERSPGVKLPVAEGSDMRFARVSFEEGPSRSSVRQILQDDLGFLWFGTQDGLKRFDGYHFREYRHQEGVQSLSGTSISDLFKDRAGTIWVASDRYLDRYDPKTEKFTPYRSDPADTRIFEGGLNQITQDPEGFLWLSTTHGLSRLDPITGKAIQYHHAAGDPYSLSGDHVKSTLVDREGTFWVATTNGLDVFDRRTGKVTRRVSLDLPGSPSEIGAYQAVSQGAIGEPLRLFEDRSGVLWVIFYFGPGWPQWTGDPAR